MDGKDVWREAKCFGSATVGPRGQVVIPANARKELGIDAGTTFLVFIGAGRRGLTLVKVDAFEQMLSMMSEKLADFEKLAKDYRPLKATEGKKRS